MCLETLKELNMISVLYKIKIKLNSSGTNGSFLENARAPVMVKDCHAKDGGAA